MKARHILTTVAATVTITCGGPPAAHAIVGGQQIDITQAPWTVHLTATNSYGTNTCTGSILDARRVLTAAHCVLRLGGQPAPAVTVLAGSSNAAAGQGQRVAAASVRSHPYAQQGLGVDDVAVVTLSRDLSLSSSVQPIALVPPGPTADPGLAVTAIGYGQQAPVGEPNGALYSLAHTLVDPFLGVNSSCSNAGDDSAVVLCPQSDAGAICFGDSGGPLVAGSPPVLVGVASRGTGVPPGSTAQEQCQAGKASAFVNLSAAEIRAFIDGSDQPPLAPRSEGIVLIGREGTRRRPRLECDPDDWANSPTLTFSWIDARNGKTVGTGRGYRIRRRDKGRELVCAVTAANAGGSITRRTGPFEISRFQIPPKQKLTRKQKLRRALRACKRKDSRAARAKCRRRANRKFGARSSLAPRTARRIA
jgi:Trypsin